MTDLEELSAARQRIAAAYDPRLLQDAGHRLADLLATHLARAEASEGAVLPWVEPSSGVREAATFLHGGVPAGLSEPELAEHFARLVQVMLGRGLNLHDPRYIGHQVPAPVPLGGLFDAVGSVTNQVMAIYEMGPWATAVEQAMIAELGAAIGWQPDTFAGAVTHGGSLANLTGLLTARNVALGGVWEHGLARTGAGAEGGDGEPVLLAHAEAHYSVARAAGILGLGSRQVVRVGLDERGRMDPAPAR